MKPPLPQSQPSSADVDKRSPPSSNQEDEQLNKYFQGDDQVLEGESQQIDKGIKGSPEFDDCNLSLEFEGTSVKDKHAIKEELQDYTNIMIKSQSQDFQTHGQTERHPRDSIGREEVSHARGVSSNSSNIFKI